MGIEIERRFLLEALPPHWAKDAQAQSIQQGYLVAEKHQSLRVRQQAGRYSLTAKYGSGLAREEREETISQSQFDILWAFTDQRQIEKTRYTLPYETWTLEIDVFAGDLAPLIIAEVEFASEAEAADFILPPECGPEITQDGRFSNAALSLHGLPSDWLDILHS